MFPEFLSMEVSLIWRVSRPAMLPAVKLILATAPEPVYPVKFSAVQISSIDPSVEFIVSKKIVELERISPGETVLALKEVG